MSLVPIDPDWRDDMPRTAVRPVRRQRRYRTVIKVFLRVLTNVIHLG